MDRVSNCKTKIDKVFSINSKQAPLLDFSSLLSRKTYHGDETIFIPSDHTSRLDPSDRTYELPILQEFTCESFGNTQSMYSDESFSTNNNIAPEITDMSSSSDESKEISSDDFITSEESQCQRALKQPSIVWPVCVDDAKYCEQIKTRLTTAR